MADEEKRTFDPGTVSSNRAQMQGLGVGQKELNMQQAPNRDAYATAPQRTEPFDERLDDTTNADRPEQADFGEDDRDDRRRDARAGSDEATLRAGDLGVGTPAGVDVHDLGQEDKPQQEWGDEVGEDMMHSANHTRRPERTEAERGQGAKTRRMTKDIISRRAPH